MLSSEADIKPVGMNFNRNSSSSFAGTILFTSFSIEGMNHTSTEVLSRLKKLWKQERATGIAAADCIGSIPFVANINLLIKNKNGLKSIKIQQTPIRLKTRCALAARFAVAFAMRAAMFAVIVVPMFSPKTKAAATSKPIKPCEHITSVTAIIAEEDWTITVSIVPIKTNNKMDK